MVFHSLWLVSMVFQCSFMVFHGFWLVSVGFRGGFMVFHGFWLVSMVFEGFQVDFVSSPSSTELNLPSVNLSSHQRREPQEVEDTCISGDSPRDLQSR